MAYAKKTSVPVERSKTEIEKTLGKYGASQFAYAVRNGNAMIAFQMNEKRVRFILPIPEQGDSYRMISGEPKLMSEKQWEQACRERWRSLCLVIKAKLEAVSSGITVFEEEFLAYIVTSGGKTIGERILPELEESIRRAAHQPLLSVGQGD